MAILLCAAFAKAGRQDVGDVIQVYPDTQKFGTHEDLDAWVAAGNQATDFPKLFYLVSCPDLTVAAAKQYLDIVDGVDANGQPALIKFRKWGFNVIATERRIGTSRSTLQTVFKITRKFADISSLFTQKS